MSIPKRDFSITKDDLQDAAGSLIEHAYDYWEMSHKAGIDGAVIWADGPQGLVIFTRGEYRETLLQNIPNMGQPYVFGDSGDESEPE